MKTLLILAVLVLCSCRKLPPSFKRCDVRSPNFDACITDAIPDAIRQLKHPFKSLGLPSFDPLLIPAITIAEGAPPMSFQQNYTNVRVSGFTNITCSKVDLNFKALTMMMRCTTPQIKMEFDYSFNGTFAFMPIFGQGPGELVLGNVTCMHSFKLDEYVKKNRTHLKITNSHLLINPDSLKLRFDNLYDGDQVMGDNVNLVMNDNWRDVYRYVRADYEEAFTIIFSHFFNQIFGRVPKSEMFAGA